MAVMIPDDVDQFCTDGERQFYGFLKTAAKPDSILRAVKSKVLSSVYLMIEPERMANLTDSIYFIIVTASTVGYGDISPSSPPGRVTSLASITLGVVNFSCMTAIISAKLSGGDKRLDEITAKQDEILRLLHKKGGKTWKP